MQCEHCGREVPDGVFCTNCGAHQGGELHPNPKLRQTNFAAHPGEHVFQPGIFTTIFPHLGHRKVHEFRWVFLGGLAGVFVLFFAGLITAALCVSVLLLPILYMLYLYEAQVYKEEPLPVLVLIVLGSIGIGIGVTIGTDHLVTGSAKFAVAVTGSSLATVGILIPLIQEAAKPITALLLRTRPTFKKESMDGLVFGVAAGLGFGVGESFVRLANVITDLPVRSTPGTWIYPLISTAVFLPLLQGTATGLICMAIWRFARGKTDLIALFAIVAAIGGHMIFSTVTQVFENHGWQPGIILAWQFLVDIALIVLLRVALHSALLEEAADMGVADRFCSNCHQMVTAEGFCPSCGCALNAVPYHTRPEATTSAPATSPAPVAPGGPAPAGGTAT